MMYTMPNGNSATNYISFGGDKDHNVIVSTNGTGAGTDGLHIDTITAGTPNYASSDAHFVNGGPRDAANSYVNKLLPKTTSRLHWANAEPGWRLSSHSGNRRSRLSSEPADAGYSWRRRLAGGAGLAQALQ